MKVVFYITGN